MTSSSIFDSPEEEDRFWLIALIPILFVTGALAPLFRTIREWLVEHHILVTENIVLPLPGGAGLDLPRTLLLAAVTALTILITVRVLIHRYKKARAARMIEGDPA